MSSSFINLSDLLEETDDLTDWFKLGVHLKRMPTKDLEDIEKRFSTTHGATRCKIALFTLWLQRVVTKIRTGPDRRTGLAPMSKIRTASPDE